MNLRRYIDYLIEQNRTENIKEILKIEKGKMFPTPMRKHTRNGRLSTAVQACKAGNVEVLAEIIRYNKGISKRDLWICLMFGLQGNKMDVVRFLLKLPKKNVADFLNNPPKNYEPTLFYARSRNALDLLLKNGADINQLSPSNETLLERKIQAGNLEDVKYLRQQGAVVRSMKQVMRHVKANRISPELFIYLQPTSAEAKAAHIQKIRKIKAADKERQAIIHLLAHKSFKEQKAFLRRLQKERD